MDMAGNVWEWTSTRFVDKDGTQRATALREGKYGCLKGGSYLSNSRGLYSWNRLILPLDDTESYVRDYYAIGFRCARDPAR
jgi:formylglycine-generating enzyme required for sulfatase activity